RISLVPLDGSQIRTFDVAVDNGTWMAFVAPDGRELLYLAPPSIGSTGAIRALDTTTGTTRTVVSTSGSNSLFGNFSVSPDGKRIAYAMGDGTTKTVKVHLANLDGSSDAVIGDAKATFEAWPQWSPDGTRLLIERGVSDGAQPVVIEVASGGEVGIDTRVSQNGAGKEQ